MSFLTKVFDIKEEICATRRATVLLSVDKNKELVTGNINLRDRFSLLTEPNADWLITYVPVIKLHIF